MSASSETSFESSAEHSFTSLSDDADMSQLIKDIGLEYQASKFAYQPIHATATEQLRKHFGQLKDEMSKQQYEVTLLRTAYQDKIYNAAIEIAQIQKEQAAIQKANEQLQTKISDARMRIWVAQQISMIKEKYQREIQNVRSIAKTFQFNEEYTSDESVDLYSA